MSKPAKSGATFALGILAFAVALALSEGLRRKALDVLFGPEEQFQFTPPATATSPTVVAENRPEAPAVPATSDLGEDIDGHVDDPPRPE